MKQFITIKQLNELSEEGRKALKIWYFPKKQLGDLILYDYPIDPSVKGKIMPFGISAIQGDPTPLLSIGQMIEFLDMRIIYLENEAGWWGIKMIKDKEIEPVPELCDALWEAVKEVLEK